MSAALVIAVDGPVAAGKGTLARRLAECLGLRHLDSGLLYRATAACLLSAGADPSHEEAAAHTAAGLTEDDLRRPDLRGEAVGRAASVVAALPAVREAVLDYQRRFAARPPGAVIDGRDIGTVVCPDAQVKIFVTASAAERARRRHSELVGRGEEVAYDTVLADLEERDRRDSTRAVAPLRPAGDAVILDTTGLDADQALAAALALIERLLKPGADPTI